MRRLSLAAAYALTAVAALSGAAADERSLARYLQLLANYADRPAEVAIQLLHESPANVAQVLQQVLRSRRALEQHRVGDTPRWASRAEMIELAALMHLHAARFGRTQPEVGAHLDAARQWCVNGERFRDLARSNPAHRRFVARVYAATSTVWLGVLDVESANAAAQEAWTVDGDDAQVLLARGSALEARALTREGLGISTPTGAAPPEDPDLATAAGVYETALARQPAALEAAVRSARVLTLLGRPSDAREHLARVFSAGPAAHLEYWAYLIAGDIEQASGHPADAMVRYRAAYRLCRGCQSAGLAVSHASLAAGDVAPARAQVLSTVASRSAEPSSDPWPLYRAGQWHIIDALLAQLLAEVPR